MSNHKMGFVSNRKNKGFGELTVNEKKVESLVKQIKHQIRESNKAKINIFTAKNTSRLELVEAVERLYNMPAYSDFLFLTPINKWEMLDLLAEASAPLTDVLYAPNGCLYLTIISGKVQEELVKEEPSFYEQIAPLILQRKVTG